MAFWGTDSCGNILQRLILAFVNSHNESSFFLCWFKKMFFINIQGIPGFVGVVGSLGMSGELVRISPPPPYRPHLVLCSHLFRSWLATCKGIQDSLGFCIQVLDFGFLVSGSWISVNFAIVSGIPDSFGWIPDYKRKNFRDSIIRISSLSYRTGSASNYSINRLHN